MNIKAFLAEFLGTMALAFAVLVSLNSPELPIPTPLIAGLTLG